MLAGWFALAILALAISAGLYIACDYAEEYSSIVKRNLRLTIYILCGIYCILCIDGLPFTRCLLGITCHLSYLSLLPTFPFIQPICIETIGCFLLTIINHLYWFSYFVGDEYRYSIQNDGITNAGMKVLGFLFVFVWFAPIGFFVSLQSIEDSLPMSSASPGGAGGALNPQQQKKGGIFKSFVDSVLSQKDAMFPGMSKRQY